MRLTRRDALAAVGAGATIGVASAIAGRRPPRADDDRTGTANDDGERRLGEPAVATLAAAAEVLYPSSVTGHREFVEAYALARTRGRDGYRAGMAEALAAVDAAARDWHGEPFAALAPATRDRLLRELGADTAEPEPEPTGTVSGRVRYYVVEELLFAFYASPPGGRLVGVENPVGYPGGTESYRRAAPADADSGAGAGDGDGDGAEAGGGTGGDDASGRVDDAGGDAGATGGRAGGSEGG